MWLYSIMASQDMQKFQQVGQRNSVNRIWSQLQSMCVENRPLEVATSSKSLSQKGHYCHISPVLFQHKLLLV